MQNAKLAGNRPGQVALTAAAAMLLVSAVLLLVVRLPAEARANDRDISGVTLTSPSPGELVIAWDAPTDAPGDCRVTWKSPRQSGLHIKNDNTEAASVRHRRPPRVTRACGHSNPPRVISGVPADYSFQVSALVARLQRTLPLIRLVLCYGYRHF